MEFVLPVRKVGAMNEDHTRSARCVALIICMGFLFTSTGWISWLYRIVALDATLPAGFVTMVCGYALQALGIGVYALLSRARSFAAQRRLTQASLALYLLLLIPSTVVGGVATTIACGLIANISCGFIQGAYLHLLAERVRPNKRGAAFGCGYAVSTLLSWLLSLPAGGALARGVPCLGACCLMAGTLAVLLNSLDEGCIEESRATQPASMRRLVVLAGAAVVTSSLVKTAGFSFPATDLNLGVDLELSRLLYGLGLVVAGFASDRDRRYGLVFCGMALVMPLLMLALSGYGASGPLLWSLGYFLTGFYTLFRVLLMVDLADSFRREGRMDKVRHARLVSRNNHASAPDEGDGHGCGAHLDHTCVAVSGLLLGRIGDALGTTLSLSLSDAPVMLIAVSAMLFVVTMAFFLLLYQRLYSLVPGPVLVPTPALVSGPASDSEPTPPPAEPAPPLSTEPQHDDARSERETFERFASTYGLTARERDVLRLVLDEQSNSEIAGKLFISEATVKYHVGNLLKKTACSNRLEILALYARK